jgi:hypothetical protein
MKKMERYSKMDHFSLLRKLYKINIGGANIEYKTNEEFYSDRCLYVHNYYVLLRLLNQ